MAALGPKSLNMGSRKKETERIEKENHAFAKRLFDKQANFSKKKLEEEYQSHLKYKKQIQKLGKKKSGDKKKEGSGKSPAKTGTAKPTDKNEEEKDEEEEVKENDT